MSIRRVKAAGRSIVWVRQPSNAAFTVLPATEGRGKLYTSSPHGGAIGPVETLTVDGFDITFDVLVKGMFLGIKHATPIMREQGSGSIINTASVAGLQAGWSPHLYSVAKKARFGKTQVLGRIGDPVDIVNASVFLASDESSYITGR